MIINPLIIVWQTYQCLTLDGLIGLGRSRLTAWQLIGDGALVGKLYSNIGTL